MSTTPEQTRRDVEAAIHRMRRDGTYDHYLGAQADAVTEHVAALLALAFPLTDADVDRIVASLPAGEHDVTEDEAREQVERVLRRVRGDDNDDGCAGVLARL